MLVYKKQKGGTMTRTLTDAKTGKVISKETKALSTKKISKEEFFYEGKFSDMVAHLNKNREKPLTPEEISVLKKKMKK